MTATAYYNEIDPFAAAWLRQLIKFNVIANGDVDERSILDVQPSDLEGYTQCHFFAGVGVWSYALRLAQWPDNRHVWTGSCPCPPFSTAGKRKRCPECGERPLCHAFKTGVFRCATCGKEWYADERHLWPEFRRLICQSRPRVCFGEQVASKDGETWLDTLSTTLELEDYAVGAPTFPACSVGAPHQRQRIYWLAVDTLDNPASPRRDGQKQDAEAETRDETRLRLPDTRRVSGVMADAEESRRGCWTRLRDYQPNKLGWDKPSNGDSVGSMADALQSRRRRRTPDAEGVQPDRPTNGRHEGERDAAGDRETGRMAHADSDRRDQTGECIPETGSNGPVRNGPSCGLDYPAGNTGPEHGNESRRRQTPGTNNPAICRGDVPNPGPGPTNGHWAAADWLLCRDGKWRPVEPGTFPLVDRASCRVVLVCAKCKTEVQVDEDMLILRKIPQWANRSEATKILRHRVLQQIQALCSMHKSEHWSLSGQEDSSCVDLRTLRKECEACSSQRQRADQQQARESGIALHEMPCLRAQAEGCFVDLRCLWNAIHSEITQEQEQDMFCPVCKRVGPHLCSKEVVSNRVGRLRGYGNAIVAQQAQAFIEAADEVLHTDKQTEVPR